MRILHVIPFFAPAWRYGGPVYAAMGLTRQLACEGHKVTVMTTTANGDSVLDVPIATPLFMEGVEVWYFPVEHPRWWYFSRSLSHVLRHQVKLFDLVHVHSIFLWPTTIATFWCRRHKVPYIIRPAGSLDPICLSKSYENWWISLKSKVKKWTYLKTLGRMDLDHAVALHFTSQAEMEAARPLKLRPPGFVVPLGIEMAPFEETFPSLPIRKRYPQLEGMKIVLFLSRLDPKKGLDILISALGDLAKRRSDFALVIAGSGSSAYESKLDKLVRRHGLLDRTIFLGFVQGKNKWSLLREVDVFILPSYQENFGLAVVEALGAGVPVIISKGVNIHREVSEAGAGFVTNLDPKQIVASVERLFDDGNLRREMGYKGKLLVSKQFTWEKVARDMIQVYDNIINGKR